MKIVQPSVTILDWNGLSKNIELGGRLCYKTEDKITEDSDIEFCERMKNFKHFSTYEHAVLTVQIVCDRGVSHELVRHRLAAYSQESTRYCNYGKGKFGGEITVIDPRGAFWNDDGCDDETCFKYWEAAVSTCEVLYMKLLEQGAKAQEARSVLPNSLKTEVLMTANVREWRHIFELRTPREAHPQMRQIMCPLANELAQKWPVLFGEFEGTGKDIPIPATINWAKQ